MSIGSKSCEKDRGHGRLRRCTPIGCPRSSPMLDKPKSYPSGAHPGAISSLISFWERTAAPVGSNLGSKPLHHNVASGKQTIATMNPGLSYVATTWQRQLCRSTGNLDTASELERNSCCSSTIWHYR